MGSIINTSTCFGRGVNHLKPHDVQANRLNNMANSTDKKTEKKSAGKVKEPKLRIDGAEVIFANMVDEGFGRSLTIKVTPEIEEKVSRFWKVNQIGNAKTVIGEPNYKMYEQTKQLSLK